MSITLDQLDKIVHSLNEDIGGSGKGYMAELYSTGYTYGISLNGFALYDPDQNTTDEDSDEAEQVERICRDSLIDFCNFWDECRARIYATRKDRVHPMEKDEYDDAPTSLWDALGETFDHELDG